VSLIVDEHRLYLSDAARIEAFRAAIHETVRPGDVVVDLGCGTGILGFFACEAGAARVYGIEQTGLIELARSLARANGFDSRITYLPGVSTEIAIPERADVVVADQIGHFGFDAGLWEYFADARQRFLRPGGALLPREVSLLVAPVEAPDLFTQVAFWSGRPAGFEFAPAREWARNTGYPTHFAASQLLSAPHTLVRAPLLEARPEMFAARAAVRIDRAGVLHGIGGWFEAQLSGSVVLTNSPLAARRINRRNVFFPLDAPCEVLPGDVVDLAMQIDPVETLVSWSATVSRGGSTIAAWRHSTWSGLLVSREELRRMRPDFAPALTARGVARRTVLELCDGRRPLADIERATYERHADLFRSRDEAAVFVAEVVSRYSA
jgi:SAM-dependent methyltransferase